MKLFTTKNIEMLSIVTSTSALLYQVYYGPNVCLNLNRASSVFCLLCSCVVLIIFVLFILLSCLLGE